MVHTTVSLGTTEEEQTIFHATLSPIAKYVSDCFFILDMNSSLKKRMIRHLLWLEAMHGGGGNGGAVAAAGEVSHMI